LLGRRVASAPRDEYLGWPVLYLNGVLQGKLELMTTIPAEQVQQVVYWSPVAATHEFGAYHAGGVLSVSTFRP
jgi:hypothetical protein